MTKKMYSFNLTVSEIEKLDALLSDTKMNRTDFFEGAMRQYNKVFYDRLDVHKAQVCADCGAVFKGVITCPKCIDKAPM